MKTGTCEICGATMRIRTHRKCCGPACVAEAARRRVAQYRIDHPNANREWCAKNRPPKGPATIECADCRTLFVRRGRQLRCDPCRKVLFRKRCRLYKQMHKEAMREYEREWTRNNMDRKLASSQRSRYSRNWLTALLRDDLRCTVCGTEERLVVHHRDGRGRTHASPNHELANLQTMCRTCHIAHHRAELKNAS